MKTTYRPGTWNVLVADHAVVALPGAVADATVADLWDSLADVTDLAVLVEMLSTRIGSLSALPQFAAVIAAGADVSVAVRGPITARVETDHGAEEVSGAHVSTWSERFIPQAHSVNLALDDSAAAVLPLRGGVVRASAVSIVLAQADAHAPDGTPDVTEAPQGPPPPSDVAETLIPEDVSLPDDVVKARSEDAPEARPEEVGAAAGVDEFDMLWGQTVHRTSAQDSDAVTDAEPVLAPIPGLPAALDPTPDAAPLPVEDDDHSNDLFTSAEHGDHDGATIAMTQLRALRDEAPPVVDAPVTDAPTAILPVASTVGTMRISTGQVVALDRVVIIGRRPRSTRSSGDNMPLLIAVDSPEQDISRNHLEVRPEHDAVIVTDLHTTNGSTLLRPGADPVRLHPGEQTIALSGDTIDLGDGVTVTFEDLP